MAKYFLLIFTILIINIKSQAGDQQQKINNQNTNNNIKNTTINPPPNKRTNSSINPPPPIKKPNNPPPTKTTNIKNNTLMNQTNATITKNDTKKEFNLTESLINFFNEMFGSNKTNNTEEEKAKKMEEERKLEQKRKENQQLKEKMEKLRLEAEKKQREREKERKAQLEKEREEFEKKIENITVSEFTTLFLEKKSGELLYHNLTKAGMIKIIFLLTDSQKTIHLNFNGPSGRGGTILIKSFRSRNFLYYEYNAQLIGQYTFYLNNYHNSDDTEVIFAICDDSKTDDKLGKKNIDKISGYLDDIDNKINQMRSKQNIINKKTSAHNESINRHNKKIILNSIIEVIAMFLVFSIQTCYIKKMVEKL